MTPKRRGCAPHRLRARLSTLGFALVMLTTATSALAGGGKPATKLVNVADTRGLSNGFAKFVADVYNDNLVLFGLLVVVIMASMGGILGWGFDRLVGLLGINLGKLDHHE